MKHLKSFNESREEESREEESREEESREEDKQDMIDYIVNMEEETDISLLKAIGDEIGRTDDTLEEYRKLLNNLSYDQVYSIYMDIMNQN